MEMSLLGRPWTCNTYIVKTYTYRRFHNSLTSFRVIQFERRKKYNFFFHRCSISDILYCFILYATTKNRHTDAIQIKAGFKSYMYSYKNS